MENAIKPIGFRSGRTVSLSYKGITKSLIFDTAVGASGVMGKIKTAQTEEQIKELLRFFDGGGIQEDTVLGFLNKNNSGEYFLKGYTTKMPNELVQKMREFADLGLSLEGLINFWLLCMDNPNPQAREDLFKFANKYNFPITPYGYFVGYKSVYTTKKLFTEVFEDEEDMLSVRNAPIIGGQLVLDELNTKTEKGLLASGHRLCSLTLVDTEEDDFERLYFIAPYSSMDDLEYYLKSMAKTCKYAAEIVDQLNDHDDDYEFSESYALERVFEALDTVEGADETDESFTDIHTETFKIQLGVPVTMDRSLCDENPNRTCSSGLHIGAPGYVKSFGYGNRRKIIACLVNPAHVVAIPYDYDFMKMRVCEYFPYAISDFDSARNLNEIDTQFYEADYIGYEREELLKRLAHQQQRSVQDQSDRTLAARERLTIINL